MKLLPTMAVAGLLLTALVGCNEEYSPKDLPEVNATNCSADFISALEPKAKREAFAHLCSTSPRGPSTPPKSTPGW